jgi:microcystin-dependent protein
MFGDGHLEGPHMSDPYLGEIQAFSFSFAASGFNQVWLPCFGQLLPIQRYPTLFALIGNSFGGNGTTQFALPNLNGTVAIGQGTGTGLKRRVIGDRVGSPTASVATIDQLGAHTHGLQFGKKDAASATAGPGSTADSVVINPDFAGFTIVADDVTLAPGSITNSNGQGLPHDNTQPTLALVWCMAVAGISPVFSS